jgi:16S rRNA (cytosine967-C5)-methyltransferase
MQNARRVALEALRETERGGQADQALRRHARQLEPRDTALATELTFGVLRRRRQLDWLIEKAAGRPISAIQPAEVALALRLGVYQMRFLTRVPVHAAVNETVELVKKLKRGAGGFANAVLRRVPGRPKTWPDLSLECSLPAWLMERWVARMGEEAARCAGLAMLRPSETWVRVPPGNPVPAHWQASKDVPGAWQAPDGDPGPYRRQDVGAQALVPLLELSPEHRLLDVCAAPGNKTAQALESGARVVACDASGRRLREFLVEGVPRVQADAAQGLPFGAVFDRILVDAPCSGTGTLGRNPEIRWRLQPEDLPRCAERQKAILTNALRCLREGGRLVYATCSLEPEENEQVVSAVAPGRVLRTMERWPGREPGDGFWAAVIA